MDEDILSMSYFQTWEKIPETEQKSMFFKMVEDIYTAQKNKPSISKLQCTSFRLTQQQDHKNNMYYKQIVDVYENKT